MARDHRESLLSLNHGRLKSPSVTTPDVSECVVSHSFGMNHKGVAACWYGFSLGIITTRPSIILPCEEERVITSQEIRKSTTYDKGVGSRDNFSQTSTQRHQVPRTVTVDGYSNAMLYVVFQIYKGVKTG